MHQQLFLGTGECITLGTALKRGGEGGIYKASKSGYVAKIYYQMAPEQIAKLQAMIANPPNDPTRQQSHCSIAWPEQLLFDSHKRCLGFLMPEIRGAQTLIHVYNPKRREEKASGFNWFYLHTTALNIAYIMAAIHSKGYVIGDIKPQNLLVNRQALVSIVDTDSFQVPNWQTNKNFRCNVASSEFTPPEMMGKDLKQLDRSELQDRFGLAIIIWHLLFGDHPFTGEWKGAGEQPSIDEKIKKGYWAYGKNNLLKPKKNAIPLEVLDRNIQMCFLRCFNEGLHNPSRRPSALEWYGLLSKVQLNSCQINVNHYYTAGNTRCPWCECKNKTGIDLFPSVKPQPLPSEVHNVLVGSNSVNLLSGNNSKPGNSSQQNLSLSHTNIDFSEIRNWLSSNITVISMAIVALTLALLFSRIS